MSTRALIGLMALLVLAWLIAMDQVAQHSWDIWACAAEAMLPEDDGWWAFIPAASQPKPLPCLR
ncbi:MULTISPECIES: hypothetical protein [Roseomonadaceae]|uniref:Uncharacterized protein n=1 Tax=Falsiroseomonas oleicola TaxID=2801474 RepID=A0ABS6HA24_9PROT|nr:hypothetical protein [Roseomonas oleicola]MBU8545567.1 hypothetical protein [Roseomonas oleicola]